MTRTEFELALDRWGPDLGRWPAGDAERGRACLAADADAVRLLEAAREVDAYLAGLQPHAPPPHLPGTIRALVAEVARPDRLEEMLGWLTGRLWRPALLAMLIAGAGFVTGTAVTEQPDPELAEDVMTLAFSDIYAELENAQP